MATEPPVEQKNSHLLVAVICLLLLLGFAATSLISYYLANQSIQKRIRTDSLPLTSDNIYSHVQRDLIRPVLISSVMSKDTFVRDWILSGELNNQPIINYLSEIQQQYSTITAFFVSDKSHRYYHSSGVLKTVSAQNPKDAWYFKAVKADADYDINLDTDTADTNRTNFFVNHKIYDYNHQLLGIIGVGLASEIIRNRIDEYQQQFNRTVYFVNKEGEVTLHGTHFSKEKTLNKMPGMSAISQHLLEKPTGSFVYHNGEHQVFVNSRFVDELGWYVVIEEANTQQTKMLHALWVNLLLSVIITLAIGWLIHYMIQRHQSELRLLLTNDYLTNLASRQGFTPVFNQMLKAAQRSQEPLSILLIDVDHFKKVNDQLGHLEGDAVLQSMADILRDSVRDCDAICRWGGEEFLVALANCNAKSAFTIAEKIRNLAAEKLANAKGAKQPITVSIGIAEYGLNESSDQLFSRADEALYHAKDNGRNQSVQALRTVNL
jgi:diguanylate cyclase (GGDEF)-like protein